MAGSPDAWRAQARLMALYGDFATAAEQARHALSLRCRDSLIQEDLRSWRRAGRRAEVGMGYHGKNAWEQCLSPANVVSLPTHSERQRSVLLVIVCTILGAAAQVFLKTGIAQVPTGNGLILTILAMAMNAMLLVGYSLYSLSAILLVLALRHGELSILYPVIALTYVWVSILSVVVFHEEVTPLRIAGIATIVCGVALLGRGSRT